MKSAHWALANEMDINLGEMERASDKKIALVTGSATGIGAKIAVDLAATGRYFVIVTGRDVGSIQRVVEECNRTAAGRVSNATSSQYAGDASNVDSITSACAFRADLSDYLQLDGLVQFVKCKFKRLNLLVNNACWRGKFASPLNAGDESFGDFKKVIHLNVSVPMYIIQKCLIPLSQRQATAASADDKSIVINVSSIASQIVVPLHSYSISKACLSELSRQLAESASGSGLLSVTISPGPVLTDERPHHQAMSNLTLMGRVGTPEEISSLVMFAIENAPLFNGKEINIDGGYLAKQKLVSQPQAHEVHDSQQ